MKPQVNIEEPKAVSYTREKDGTVTDRHLNDVFNTIHTGTGGGGNTDCYIAEPMCSVHPLSHAKEFNPETSIKTISPALRATDYKCPHCVYEPRVMQVGNLYPDTDNFKNRTMGRVYSADGLSPSINCCGGGDREPKVLQLSRGFNKGGVRKIAPTITSGSFEHNNFCIEPLLIPEATTKGYAEAYDGDSVNLALPNSKTRRGRVGHQQANTLDTSCNQGVVTNYRIRKLTPRECFRLMDVSETDIDKLLNAGISNSQLYKLAGNSIVVSCLYHIFRKMFIEPQNENQQLTLF